MLNYLIRRMLYAIPILLAINVTTFALFFILHNPDQIARVHIGEKYATDEAILLWKQQRGYDLPLFYAAGERGVAKWTRTLFYTKTIELIGFRFGLSDAGRDIAQDIRERMWPSLVVAVPTLLLGVSLNITLALVMSFYHGKTVDRVGVSVCIAMMSISALFYIVAGQYLFSKLWKWAPVSGYLGGLHAIQFVALPIVVAAMSGLGAGARWYRALFLEEMERDYVRTARAKGLGDGRVMFAHVLKNGMIPIVTGVVVLIPTLFTGSLILESFFAIPGLGSYTITAIHQHDFAIVRAMVYLGSCLYIVGLIMTDLAYTWVDPRVHLE